MSTLNLCFKQIYEKYQSFSSENFQFLEVKFSIYLNKRVFVMLHMCLHDMVKTCILFLLNHKARVTTAADNITIFFFILFFSKIKA